MFSKGGQVEVTILIFAILLFLVTFELNLSEIEDKVIEGIDKTSRVIYKEYERKEEELSKSNFVRMWAHRIAEENELYNTTVDFKGDLCGNLSETLSCGKLSLGVEEESSVSNTCLVDYNLGKNYFLRIPNCINNT